jgi:hypothetical protein
VWQKKDIHTGYWRGNLKEKDQFEDLDIDRKIILQLSERNKMEMREFDSSGSEWRWFAVVNQGYTPSRFTKSLQFLDRLRLYWLLKKDCGSWFSLVSKLVSSLVGWLVRDQSKKHNE